MISTHTETGEKFYVIQGLTHLKPPRPGYVVSDQWRTWAIPVEHPILQQLDPKLKDVSFCPGQEYQHFKGDTCQLFGVAWDWETEQELAHYQHADETWLRPWTSDSCGFTGNVEIDGIVVPRFKFLGYVKYLEIDLVEEGQ